MRGIKKGTADNHVMEVLAGNYDKLKQLCGYRKSGLYCSKSYEDIFEDTILFVAQDTKAASLKSDKEIIDYFRYRYRMIQYQTINDGKQLKEIHYADYLQTKEKTREDR